MDVSSLGVSPIPRAYSMLPTYNAINSTSVATSVLCHPPVALIHPVRRSFKLYIHWIYTATLLSWIEYTVAIIIYVHFL